MASPTKKHKTRRVAKLARLGKSRKNQVRLHGSTAPDLPLNKPNAHETKQSQTQKAAPAK
jgi:hypothetical protein